MARWLFNGSVDRTIEESRRDRQPSAWDRVAGRAADLIARNPSMAPPSLVALTGPLRGRTFDLAGDRLAVGRHPTNDLRIPELSVSRHHCTLHRTAEGWRISDLDSRLGTFINGRPVHEAPLRHGDLVAIGDSTFLVSLEDEPAAAEPVLSEEAALEAGTAIRLPVGDSVYLKGGLRGRLPDARDERTARSLAALLEIAAACGVLREPEALAGWLLELVLGAVAGERGAVLFLDGDEEGSPAVYRQAGEADTEEAPFAVSRTLVRRVLAERSALLWNGPQGGPAPAESVTGAGVQALLAVPLVYPERQDKAFGLRFHPLPDKPPELGKGIGSKVGGLDGIGDLPLEQGARRRSRNR